MPATNLTDIISLCKRRGFVFPGSEIYGGLANTYDYGPLGVELLRNIKNLWWDFFVTSRADMFGLDTNVLMSPHVWEASGHVANFADTLIDCRECQYRTRADHLIEDHFASKNQEVKVEGKPENELDQIIKTEKIPCPNCKKHNWTAVRKFNNLFETHVGIIPGDKSLAYLRGEIAQGMFVNFRNVTDSMRTKLPFGLAQSGQAFRNEITPGKFIHRTLTFNLSEFEYFFDPEKQNWEELYEYWQTQMYHWTTALLGIKEDNLRWREHADDERSHYSKRTKDLEYNYPFGFKELYGFAYRTDFDLRNHMEKSGADLQYIDPESGKKFIPHVLEPSFGMDRSVLAVLCEAYTVEETSPFPSPTRRGKSLLLAGEGQDEVKKRTVLKLPPYLAPYKAAVFPLLANKEQLVAKARVIFQQLIKKYPITTDERGNIGKRYFAQDEIGTPFCITIDFQTLEDDTVTVRDRDTAKQERINISQLDKYLEKHVTFNM